MSSFQACPYKGIPLYTTLASSKGLGTRLISHMLTLVSRSQTLTPREGEGESLVKCNTSSNSNLIVIDFLESSSYPVQIESICTGYDEAHIYVSPQFALQL